MDWLRLSILLSITMGWRVLLDSALVQVQMSCCAMHWSTKRLWFPWFWLMLTVELLVGSSGVTKRLVISIIRPWGYFESRWTWICCIPRAWTHLRQTTWCGTILENARTSVTRMSSVSIVHTSLITRIQPTWLCLWKLISSMLSFTRSSIYFEF